MYSPIELTFTLRIRSVYPGCLQLQTSEQAPWPLWGRRKACSGFNGCGVLPHLFGRTPQPSTSRDERLGLVVPVWRAGWAWAAQALAGDAGVLAGDGAACDFGAWGSGV